MNDTSCADYIPSIVHAADGTLDDTARAGLDAHLRGCEACRAALASQQLARAALLRREPVGATPGFEARVADRLGVPDERASWLDRFNWQTWTWRFAPVAAALALYVLVGLPGRTATAADDTAESMASTTPVSAAIWSDAVSETSLLKLMLTASADDTLADHLKQGKQP